MVIGVVYTPFSTTRPHPHVSCCTQCPFDDQRVSMKNQTLSAKLDLYFAESFVEPRVLAWTLCHPLYVPVRSALHNIIARNNPTLEHQHRFQVCLPRAHLIGVLRKDVPSSLGFCAVILQMTPSRSDELDSSTFREEHICAYIHEWKGKTFVYIYCEYSIQ